MSKTDWLKASKISVKTYVNKRGVDRVQILCSRDFAEQVAASNHQAVRILVERLRSELGLDAAAVGSLLEAIGIEPDNSEASA